VGKIIFWVVLAVVVLAIGIIAGWQSAAGVGIFGLIFGNLKNCGKISRDSTDIYANLHQATIDIDSAKGATTELGKSVNESGADNKKIADGIEQLSKLNSEIGRGLDI
jgi:hypothetical protein